MASEYDEQRKTADAIAGSLKELRAQLAQRYRRLSRRGSMWQTVVVLATALSTGLAGYQAHQGIDVNARLALAIIVALTGTVAAIRDAWRVTEMLGDARIRYSEITTVLRDLQKAIFDAEGFSREEDRLKLGGAVRYAQSRFDELSDELSELGQRSIKDAKAAAQIPSAVPPPKQDRPSGT